MKGENNIHGAHWLNVMCNATLHANAPLRTCCALINPMKIAQPKMNIGT
jgi:hypothetical protein